MGQLDTLRDYAKAAWYCYVTNLPASEAGDAGALLNEVAATRQQLLMWATPLVGAGLLDGLAVARIREGSGYKDSASDLVALVELYRAKWQDVEGMCGVTEQELARAAQIAPAAFGLLSRRQQAASMQSDGTLRVRRAWTMLDRAYTQCRRALAYLRHEQGDVDLIAPSLRRNAGPRANSEPVKRALPASGDGLTPPSSAPASASASMLPPAGAPIGGPSDPFANN